MRPLGLAALVLAAGILLPSSAAVPPQTFVGALDFDLVAEGCAAQNHNPPGLLTWELVNAAGMVNGSPVTSPLVTIAVQAPGANLVFCADAPGGSAASGQGTGTLTAA